LSINIAEKQEVYLLSVTYLMQQI